MLRTFVWTFIGALVYIFSGFFNQTPKEEFNGKKALETLAIALFVVLISIALNVPPAEAMAQLEQWTSALIHLATSTGLIAVIDFWIKAVWRNRSQQP